MALSQAQKKHLKGLAHHLKPVLILGQHGVTESLLNEMGVGLDAHELIKVKLHAADRTERDALIERLTQASGATFIHRIGNMAVFFRRNEKQPRVALPGN
jgi:RNA-binding protein